MRALVTVLSTDHSTIPTVAIAVLSATLTVNVAVALEVPPAPPLPPVPEPVPATPPVVLPDMPAEPETAPLPPVLVIPPFPLDSGVVSDPHAVASSVIGSKQAAGTNQRRDLCIKKFSPYDMVSARRGSRLTDVTP